MINLHCHSLLSDGELLPSEIAVRYQSAGYKLIAITDHVDFSNIDSCLEALIKFTKKWPKESGIEILAGIELTHLPPEQFKTLANRGRKKGAQIIVAHGQTPVEPVIKGTNRAALLSDIDILAHPGMITEEEAIIAREKGIFLEITSRRGHKETNAHVASIAKKTGAPLVLNTDSHAPVDIITPEQLKQVGLDAGLSQKDIEEMYKTLGTFLSR